MDKDNLIEEEQTEAAGRSPAAELEAAGQPHAAEQAEVAERAHAPEQEEVAERTHAAEQVEAAEQSHAAEAAERMHAAKHVVAMDQDIHASNYHKTINNAKVIVENFLNGEQPVNNAEVNDGDDILNIAIIEAFLESVRTTPPTTNYIPKYLTDLYEGETLVENQQEIDKAFFDYALLEDHCLHYNQLNYLHENRSIKKYLVNYDLLLEQGKMYPGFIQFLDTIEQAFKIIYDDVEQQYPYKKRIDRQNGIECKKISFLRNYALAKINSATDMLTVYSIYANDSRTFQEAMLATLVCEGNSFNYNNERAYMEQETRNLLNWHSNMCVYNDDYTNFDEMDINLFPVKMLDIIENLGYLILRLLENGWKPKEWKPRLQESFLRSFLRHLRRSSWMQYNYFFHYLELDLKDVTNPECKSEDEGKDKNKMRDALDLLKKERKALRVYGAVFRINRSWEPYIPDKFKDRVLKALKTIEDFAIIQEECLNGMQDNKRTRNSKLQNPLLEFGLDANLLPVHQPHLQADTGAININVKKNDEKTYGADEHYVLPNMNELDDGQKWKQIHIDMTQDYMNIRPNFYSYFDKDNVIDSDIVDIPKVSASNPIKKIYKKMNAALKYRDNFIKPALSVIPVEPKPKPEPKPTAKILADASKAKFNKKKCIASWRRTLRKTNSGLNISNLPPKEDYERGLPIRIDIAPNLDVMSLNFMTTRPLVYKLQWSHQSLYSSYGQPLLVTARLDEICMKYRRFEFDESYDCL